MKIIMTKFLVITITIIMFSSCFKSPNHSIRVKNSYSVAMREVKINSNNYGQIASGSTTSYKPVDEGNLTVTGSTVNNQPLTGGGSVSGKGTHKWTMTISISGTLALTEDK